MLLSIEHAILALHLLTRYEAKLSDISDNYYTNRCAHGQYIVLKMLLNCERCFRITNTKYFLYQCTMWSFHTIQHINMKDISREC